MLIKSLMIAIIRWSEDESQQPAGDISKSYKPESACCLMVEPV